MYIKLLDFGWIDFITLEDVKSGNVDRQSFSLSGWEIFGNTVLDYFYKNDSLDLYINLYKYIFFAAHSSRQTIEYSLEHPLSLYPLGTYSSHLKNKQITFQPLEMIPLSEYTTQQKKEGRVVNREIDSETLKMGTSEFLNQLRAPVPELTTMLYYLVEGKVVEFQPSLETNKELFRLWDHLENTGVI